MGGRDDEHDVTDGRVVAAILTPDQRVRVFVSSTMEELATERIAVRDAVDRMRLSPVLFELGARAHPPRSLYRSYLEQSHVFVGHLLGAVRLGRARRWTCRASRTSTCWPARSRS